MRKIGQRTQRRNNTCVTAQFLPQSRRGTSCHEQVRNIKHHLLTLTAAHNGQSWSAEEGWAYATPSLTLAHGSLTDSHDHTTGDLMKRLKITPLLSWTPAHDIIMDSHDSTDSDLPRVEVWTYATLTLTLRIKAPLSSWRTACLPTLDRPWSTLSPLPLFRRSFSSSSSACLASLAFISIVKGQGLSLMSSEMVL